MQIWYSEMGKQAVDPVSQDPTARMSPAYSTAKLSFSLFSTAARTSFYAGEQRLIS